jgi:hypothetical protein
MADPDVLDALQAVSRRLLLLAIGLPILGSLLGAVAGLYRQWAIEPKIADERTKRATAPILAEMDTHKARIGAAETEAATATAATRSAESALAVARDEIARLHRCGEPRQFTEAQRAALRIALQGHDGRYLAILVPMSGDQEVIAYANLIRDIFRAAGWNAKTVGSNLNASGLELHANGSSPGAIASVIAHAFERAGVRFRAVNEPSFEAGSVALQVGPRSADE